MSQEQDDIPTPNTSRSNSASDESGERPISPVLRRTTEHDPSNSNEITNDNNNEQTITPAKRTTFISSSSSSSNDENELEPNFNSHIANDASAGEIQEQHQDISTENHKTVTLRENVDSNENQSIKHESFFQDQQRLSQFEDFPSEQPLNTQAMDTIHSDIDNPFNQSANIDDEPWELEEHGEETIKPIPTFITQNQSSFTEQEQEQDDNDENSTSESENNENVKENDDNYLHNENNHENNNQSTDLPAFKSVRFDDNLQNINVFTPKNSLIQSETSSQTTTTTTSDTDDDDEQIATKLPQTIEQHNQDFNDATANHNSTENIAPRPDSIISLSSDIISFPPPLPPLPPLDYVSNNTNNSTQSKSISSKQSSINESKGKKNSFVHLENTSANLPTTTTTDTHLYNNTEPEFMQSHGSAILRSTSSDGATVDSDEVNNVIVCMIDNNEIKIDAKTISPFKCVIGSAGHLHEEAQTAVIILYGCWLPDHRLREYRYIMDQLFYYVYHKLEKLVSNDYVLVYFHGATPKHRTPELKFLRKCYQMINFRLRKNLRHVYVVHPTRWLRTIIALSRPFFSNKFYHKVQYLYTIAELERQFPDNNIPIPVIIEQLEIQHSRIDCLRFCC